LDHGYFDSKLGPNKVHMMRPACF